MVFSSTVFLFLFLPLFFALYFLSPKNVKNLTLLLFSLIFYTWGENKLVLLLILSSLIDFTCGIIIENGRRRLGLIISICFNLLILLSFKYLDFAFENFNHIIKLFVDSDSSLLKLPHVALPIGISFYTFQTMSYTIDVYRGHVKANRNFINFAAYVTMFPQLVAGPIVRYSDIQKQLTNKEISVNNVAAGIERFIIGLVKKVLFANTFAAIADSVFDQNVTDLSSGYAWLGIIAYTFQIYFDFSGYSDMAIGLGKILGFNFPENFNFPYISKSIKEFWRRWHISLSTWFRDYVYISLGGNRKGIKRTYINLFVVFFITGLWHGASWNFVVWGLFHGLFLVLERVGIQNFLNKLHVSLQHVYALLIVVIGWVFFRTNNINDAFIYLGKMFIPSSGSQNVNEYLSLFYLNNQTLLITILAVVFSMPVYNHFQNWMKIKRLIWINHFTLILAFVIVIIYLTNETYNPFIYFRF